MAASVKGAGLTRPKDSVSRLGARNLKVSQKGSINVLFTEAPGGGGRGRSPPGLIYIYEGSVRRCEF